MRRLPALHVNGAAYSAWTGLRLVCGIEQGASWFELQVTDDWPAGKTPDIAPGMPCTLALAGTVLLTGHIDTLTRAIDATSHRVSVSGRDKTADLIDCSARITTYTDQDLRAIAVDQARDYGVTVETNGSLGEVFPRVAVDPGETVWELLERLARQRGVLLLTDGTGGLVIGQPKRDRAPDDLVLGENLLALEWTSDLRERFSEYQGRAQMAGYTDRTGLDAAQVAGQATDDYMAKWRKRLKIVRAEANDTTIDQRVKWERAVRIGRSLTLQATVQGWGVRHPELDLWRCGTLVKVQAEALKIDGDYLIGTATYLLDEQGTRTELSLCHPAAYLTAPPEPDPEQGERYELAGADQGTDDTLPPLESPESPESWE